MSLHLTVIWDVSKHKTLKRAPHIRKRARYIRKRALPYMTLMSVRKTFILSFYLALVFALALARARTRARLRALSLSFHQNSVRL